MLPHSLPPPDFDRGKRGAIELALIMKCVSPSCDPIDYKGYGCYCGFMGAGVPVDGIDMYVRSASNNFKYCTEIG